MKLITLRIVGDQADNHHLHDPGSGVLDNIRRFRALHEAGATYKEIAEARGVDWRTVKKYLTEPAGATPPAAPSREGTQPQVVAPYMGVINAMLRADPTMKALVIYERLVAGQGYDRSYQRVKLYVAQARPRLAAEAGTEVATERMRGLHRRFETTPGAQAQVDWGEEGDLPASSRIAAHVPSSMPSSAGSTDRRARRRCVPPRPAAP
jgi:transposase